MCVCVCVCVFACVCVHVYLYGNLCVRVCVIIGHNSFLRSVSTLLRMLMKGHHLLTAH